MSMYYDVLCHGVVKPEYRNVVCSNLGEMNWRNLTHLDFVQKFLEWSTTKVFPSFYGSYQEELANEFPSFYNEYTGEWQFTTYISYNRSLDLMAFEEYIIPNFFSEVYEWSVIFETTDYAIWKETRNGGWWGLLDEDE